MELDMAEHLACSVGGKRFIYLVRGVSFLCRTDLTPATFNSSNVFSIFVLDVNVVFVLDEFNVSSIKSCQIH